MRHPDAAAKRGIALLHDTHINKSTAFSEAERDALGLVGLVPEGIDSEEAQLERVRALLERKPSNLEQYLFLSGFRIMTRRSSTGS
jgi:malate dehydrogenase (oxaloacetate-decarboxylating)(NADP+)